MLVHRLWSWSKIKTAFGKHPVIGVMLQAYTCGRIEISIEMWPQSPVSVARCIDKLGISHLELCCVPNSLMTASNHYSVEGARYTMTSAWDSELSISMISTTETSKLWCDLLNRSWARRCHMLSLSWSLIVLPLTAPLFVRSVLCLCVLSVYHAGGQTRDVDPMPGYCWPTVYDAEPTLAKYWVTVSCLTPNS